MLLRVPSSMACTVPQPIYQLILMLLLVLAAAAVAPTTSVISAAAAAAAPPPPPPPLPRHRTSAQTSPQSGRKIEHFVVLMMENRPFEHMFGCLAGEGRLPGADGAIPQGGKRLYKDPTNHSAGFVTVTCGTANYSCRHGPGYSTWTPKFPKNKTDSPPVNPNVATYSNQSNAYSYEQGAHDEAIKMFSPQQLPIKTTLAEQFGVFNRIFSSVPGNSAPNHMMMQSATSCGTATNVEYNKCGGSQKFFPQRTIYDSLHESNRTFGMYVNGTDSQHWNWTGGNDWTSGDWPYGDIQFPDAMMEGVARHKDHFYTFGDFFAQAANGSLPHFSMIRGNNSNGDHPCYDVARGERLHKDLYEALRAGPKWNHTLFLILYDDAGGFYDSVVPPVNVPADESPCTVDPGCARTGAGPLFDFKRLGLRVTALLISPWIPANTVFQRPRGPYNDSEFDLTSVCATTKQLFNLSSFLTKRDEWSGSFDELLTLDEPRTDAPMHLPEAPVAPPCIDPWCPPKTARRRQQLGHHASMHCSATTGTCAGFGGVSTSQRRKIQALAALTDSNMPQLDQLTQKGASDWIGQKWAQWMQMPAPPKLSENAAKLARNEMAESSGRK
jgi:phospholipase C